VCGTKGATLQHLAWTGEQEGFELCQCRGRSTFEQVANSIDAVAPPDLHSTGDDVQDTFNHRRITVA
jgi:hypothetical protein